MSLTAFEQIKQLVQASSQWEELAAAWQKEPNLAIKNAAGSLSSIIITLLRDREDAPVLCLVPHLDQAERMREEMFDLLGSTSVFHFPPSKIMPWGHRDAPTVSQQMEVVEALLGFRGQSQNGNGATNSAPMIIATPKALLAPIVSLDFLQARKLALRVGDEIPFDTLLNQLVEMGFERQPVVELQGEMSVRGGIVDLFPFSRGIPIRFEFWGDKIESIREFDPTTQRSEQELVAITLFPQIIEDEGSKSKQKKAAEKTTTLLNYFPENTLVCIHKPEQIIAALEHSKKNEEELAEVDDLDDEGEALWEALLKRFERFRRVTFTQFRHDEGHALDFLAQPQPAIHGDLKALRQELEKFNAKIEFRNPRLFFVCESASHAERLSDLFAETELAQFNIELITGNLNHGFVWNEVGLAVYTDHEFYGRTRRPQRKRRYKDGLTFRQLKTLARGDYVVHIDHGIGVYQGLQKIKAGAHERECLVIHYQDNDKLYVPLEKMDCVQKYTSRESVVPKIHKLGSPDWERLKSRTKKRIKDIAKDLIALYAARKAQKGHAFSQDTLWQKELEASFEFEETPDQTKAIEEVKLDMESEKPMDRLVCGDVGFGKTEVAIRAAFKAVQDGKQAAILVPTTLLAEQHFNTFRQRLSRYPVKVEMLSRFRTRAEQTATLELLKDGKVDIIIGTHRLFSKDVAFKDLGLIVIDEEQRFGVRHKERLKSIKVNADVLALSATPIPRTLNMALMGVRDMTNIITPPKDRQPIQTEVSQFERDLIRQVIMREIHRGGQVFFVHNRVHSIYRMAGLIKKLVPEVEIGVAHGQMNEHELEKVMLGFINREFNVLVATMIIESGLDIPNTNTMIINRADRFGLAQLYQLRGRVGRSHHKAYCYLMIPPIRNLSLEAIKRLETIEEFTDLGSGLQIAMRDLEIRGAGNMLGAEQSGLIDAIGYDLYVRILDQAVREARYEAMPETEPLLVEHEQCKVELDEDAFLPEDYVSRAEERVAIYRRVAEAQNLKEIEAITEELRDRFGRLPGPAQNLLGLASVRLLGTRLGLRTLRILTKESFGVFSDEVRPQQGEPFKNWVGSIVQRAAVPIEFFQNGGLGFRMRVPKGQYSLPATVKLLASLQK
ncbi:transcription-repair coupling factor [candidate division KSB1 bacterium]|nr:transcription-repair coupling factor [candidate division KSB1 bacterium]